MFSQEKTIVPIVSRLEEFLKNTHLIFCLLKSLTNLFFLNSSFNKWRNGKSLKEVEKCEGEVSKRGVKDLVLCNTSSRCHRKNKLNSLSFE